MTALTCCLLTGLLVVTLVAAGSIPGASSGQPVTLNTERHLSEPTLSPQQVRSCQDHKDCSCQSGIAVCFNYVCQCIYTHERCRGWKRKCPPSFCQYGTPTCLFGFCTCSKDTGA